MAKFRRIIALILVLVVSHGLLGNNALAMEENGLGGAYVCPECGASLDAPEEEYTWQHTDGEAAHLGERKCSNSEHTETGECNCSICEEEHAHAESCVTVCTVQHKHDAVVSEENGCYAFVEATSATHEQITIANDDVLGAQNSGINSSNESNNGKGNKKTQIHVHNVPNGATAVVVNIKNELNLDCEQQGNSDIWRTPDDGEYVTESIVSVSVTLADNSQISYSVKDLNVEMGEEGKGTLNIWLPTGEETTQITIKHNFMQASDNPKSTETADISGTITKAALETAARGYALTQDEITARSILADGKNFQFLYKYAVASQDKDGAWTLDLYYQSVRFYVTVNGIPAGSGDADWTAGIPLQLKTTGDKVVALVPSIFADGRHHQYEGKYNDTNAADVGAYVSALTADQVTDLQSAIQARGGSFDPDTQEIVWYTVHEGNWVHVDGHIRDKELPAVTYHPNYPEATGTYSGTVTGREDGEQLYNHTVVDYATTALPARSDEYKFSGWNTQADGMGDSYNAGDEIRLSKSVDFYAVWTDATTPSDKYTLTFEWATDAPNPGLIPPLPTSKEYSANAEIDLSKILGETEKSYFTKGKELAGTNFIFDGWYFDKEGKEEVTPFNINKNTVIYGRWAVKQVYTVSYSWNANLEGTDYSTQLLINTQSVKLPVDNKSYPSAEDIWAKRDTTYKQGDTATADDIVWRFSGWTEHAVSEQNHVTIRGSWVPVTYDVTLNFHTRDLAEGSKGPLDQPSEADYTKAGTATLQLNAVELAQLASRRFTGEGAVTAEGVSFYKRATNAPTVSDTSYLGMIANGKEYGLETFGDPNNRALFVNGTGYGDDKLTGADLTKAATEAEDGKVTIDYYFAQIVHFSVDYGHDTAKTKVVDVQQIFSTRTATGVDIPATLNDPTGAFRFTGWQVNEQNTEVGDFKVGEYSRANVDKIDKTVDGNDVEQLWFNFVSQWTANSFNVTYEWDGSAPSGVELPSQGQPIPVPFGTEHTIAKNYDMITIGGANWTFNGWTIKTEGVTQNEGKFNMPAKNVVIKGSWSSAASGNYSVTYQPGDGATGTSYSTGYPTTDSYTVLDNANENIQFAKAGYNFTGWSASISGAETEIGKTASALAGGSSIVYTAQWTPMTDVSVTVVKSSNRELPAGFTISVTEPVTDGEAARVLTLTDAGTPDIENGEYTYTWRIGLTYDKTYTFAENNYGIGGYNVTQTARAATGSDENGLIYGQTGTNSVSFTLNSMGYTDGAAVAFDNEYYVPYYPPPYVPPTTNPTDEPVIIDPEDTPLNPTVPVEDGGEEELTTIDPDDVALDDSPKTGDNAPLLLLWLCFIASGCGLVILGATAPKKRENDAK